MKLPNAVGHVLFGLLIGIPIALVTWNPLIGWAAQAFYFLGRERRDHEIASGLNPFTEWWKGWNPLTWKHDGQIDLAAPVLVNGAIAVAAWYFLWR